MAVNQTSLAAKMTAAMAAVAAAVSAAGTLASASLAQLVPVQKAVASALPTTTAAVSALDADIPTANFAGMIVGSPVPALVLALQTAASEVGQQGVAFNAQSYLARMNANLVNAAG